MGRFNYNWTKVEGMELSHMGVVYCKHLPNKKHKPKALGQQYLPSLSLSLTLIILTRTTASTTKAGNSVVFFKVISLQCMTFQTYKTLYPTPSPLFKGLPILIILLDTKETKQQTKPNPTKHTHHPRNFPSQPPNLAFWHILLTPLLFFFFSFLQT